MWISWRAAPRDAMCQTKKKTFVAILDSWANWILILTLLLLQTKETFPSVSRDTKVGNATDKVGLISKNFTTTDGFGFVIISAASRHCWRILYGRQRDSVKWKEGLTNQHLRNAWLHCIIDFHGWIQRGIVNMGKSLSHHSHEGHGECEVVVEMSHRYELHETSGIKKTKQLHLKSRGSSGKS